MGASEWSDPAHVRHYLTRTAGSQRLAEGDSALLEVIAPETRRVLDLGTGDGRLLSLLARAFPAIEGVGIDSSELMLSAASERFAGDIRFSVLDHDLTRPLPDLGAFDAVVSCMAIHHLEHERKRSLYGEAFAALVPGGTFANLEHVASPTRRLHLDFFAAIEEPLECEDASDRLLDVETQLGWLREIGFEDVDCHWKWRELALLAGTAPGLRRRRARRPPREPATPSATVTTLPALGTRVRHHGPLRGRQGNADQGADGAAPGAGALGVRHHALAPPGRAGRRRLPLPLAGGVRPPRRRGGLRRARRLRGASLRHAAL